MACLAIDRRLSLVMWYRLLTENDLQAHLIRCYYVHFLFTHSKSVFETRLSVEVPNMSLEHP